MDRGPVRRASCAGQLLAPPGSAGSLGPDSAGSLGPDSALRGPNVAFRSLGVTE
ncbi:hypothetical protein RhoFasB10_02479 [Rhodococcus sp. B10]|nr:hypothetical protein [Rhodococcus sp. B10]